MNIHWPTFIVALAVGLFFVYITRTAKQSIIVYPTPENVDRVQYKDAAGTCYTFSAATGPCPSDSSAISTPPIQNIRK